MREQKELQFLCQDRYVWNPVTSFFEPLGPLLTYACQGGHSTILSLMNTRPLEFCLSTNLFWLLRERIVPVSEGFELLNTFRISMYISSQIVLSQNELYWLTIDYKVDDRSSLTNQLCYCIYSANLVTMVVNKKKLHVVELCDLAQFLKCNGVHLFSEVEGSLCLTTVLQSTLRKSVLVDRLNFVWTWSHLIHLEDLSNWPSSLCNFWSDDICVVAVRGLDASNLRDLVKILIHHEDQLLLYNLKSGECRKIEFLKKDQKLCRPDFFHSNRCSRIPTPAITEAENSD